MYNNLHVYLTSFIKIIQINHNNLSFVSCQNIPALVLAT